MLAGRFGLEMETLSAIDSQLPISMLRIAFVACVTPANRLWGANEETEKSKKEYKENIRTAIDAELKWLTDNGVEPHWPHFPSSKPRRRRGLHLSYTEEDDAVILDKKAKETTTWEVDSRAASVWLGNLIPSLSLSGPMKLISLIDFYTSWTIMANGQGMEPNEEPEGTPLEWNNEYYRALALCFPSLKQQEIDKLIKLNICSLPDKPFFDILSSFLPDLDAVYLNGSEVDTLAPRTIDIRETFCARMLDSVGWHWLTTSYSSTVETHIGPAIAAL